MDQNTPKLLITKYIGFLLRGKKDPLGALDEYRSKVKQHMRDALEKGRIKAQVHMICEFKKTDSDKRCMTEAKFQEHKLACIEYGP